MFQLSIPVRTRGAMAMTTPDIRLHALNWPCSVYVIINLPQHGLAVCNMIWTLTYMYVYSYSYRLYRLLWGLVTKAKLGKKNKQCTCHCISSNLSGLMCISWYILLILKRSSDSAEFPSWSMSSAQRTKKDADIMNYV